MELDNFTPDFQERIYPTYRQLRDEHPVFWDAGQKAWLLSRYEDVHYVLTEPELFSSEAMGAALGGRPPETTTSSETARVVIMLEESDPEMMRPPSYEEEQQ